MTALLASVLAIAAPASADSFPVERIERVEPVVAAPASVVTPARPPDADVAAYAALARASLSRPGLELVVDTQPSAGGHDIGQPLAELIATGRCHISLRGLDRTIARYGASDRAADAGEPLRRFIVLHEAAHCAAMDRLESARRDAPGDLVASAIMQAQEASRVLPGTDAGNALVTLVSERAADAEALLHLAHLGLRDADSDAALAAAHAEWVAQAHAARRFRDEEARSIRALPKGYAFNDHNSADIVAAVQNYVRAGVSGAGRAGFAREALQPGPAQDAAWRLALGSLLHELPSLQRAVLNHLADSLDLSLRGGHAAYHGGRPASPDRLHGLLGQVEARLDRPMQRAEDVSGNSPAVAADALALYREHREPDSKAVTIGRWLGAALAVIAGEER